MSVRTYYIVNEYISTGHLSRKMNNEYNAPHVCVDLAALPYTASILVM